MITKGKSFTLDGIVYICPGCHMARACVLEDGKFIPRLKVLSQEEATAWVLGGAKVLKLGCRGCESRGGSL
jgi:hypothetical protein